MISSAVIRSVQLVQIALLQTSSQCLPTRTKLFWQLRGIRQKHTGKGIFCQLKRSVQGVSRKYESVPLEQLARRELGHKLPFYMWVQGVKHCIYLTVIAVSSSDKIALRVCSPFDDLCTYTSDTMQLVITSSRLEVVFQQTFEIAINSTSSMQCKQYQTHKDIVGILINNPETIFTVQGIVLAW
ncbi:hypothetical protein SS50377_28628 [Spironucleus salmonicida]|uniref:Uncharacterized protein n=1 Tax=Spironucleus salmonicida TaxID=348837 RepID=V6LLI4_9EUKA|nr:hypothetical protein SS50377_28628 [Spironucleus salmonicida]|eukprot:EST41554.1 Hypothetical protein SS50377_18892 [Spironucleus salmonicida]